MARALRLEYEGAIYHVMNRGIARRALFADQRDYERFLQSLARAVDRAGVRVYAYSLMPNHFHLLVETPRANLSDFMLSLQTSYGVYFNRRHRKSGYVFEGPYRSKVVEGDEYLLRLSRYIHLNAVRTKAFAGAPMEAKIKDLRKYRWSSYPAYAGGAKRWAWMDYGPLAELVKDHGGGMRTYVEGGLAQADEEWERIMASSPIAVGSEGFMEEMKRAYRLRAQGKRKEDISFRRMVKRMPKKDIMEAVRRGLNLEKRDGAPTRGMAWSRGVTARMLIKYAGMTQREAAAELGLTTGAAVSIQLKSLARMQVEDRSLRNRIAAIDQELAETQARA